jgi:hypothetical protein
MSPFDIAAKILNIHNIFITIPAIPKIGLTKTKVGLIYFIFIGILYLIFGYKAILFSMGLYFMYKQGKKED